MFGKDKDPQNDVFLPGLEDRQHQRLNSGGRAALCGSIAGYNATGAEVGITNTSKIVSQGLTLTGFTVGNYLEHSPAFAAEMGPWLASGQVVFDETVVDGIEHTFDAFTGLMRGHNVGKMVVRITP